MAAIFSLTIHSSTLSTRRPYVTEVATLAANLCGPFSIPVGHRVRGEITFGDGAPNPLARSGADVAALRIPEIGSRCMYPLAANGTQYVTPNTCYEDAAIGIRCSSPSAIYARALHSGALNLACYPTEFRLLIEANRTVRVKRSHQYHLDVRDDEARST